VPLQMLDARVGVAEGVESASRPLLGPVLPVGGGVLVDENCPDLAELFGIAGGNPELDQAETFFREAGGLGKPPAWNAEKRPNRPNGGSMGGDPAKAGELKHAPVMLQGP
jgi:hypothetical protein